MSHRGETTTDCRSDEGITVGLVDALITILRVLAKRDLSPAVVQESLKDLLSDEDLRCVFMAGNLAALKAGLKVDTHTTEDAAEAVPRLDDGQARRRQDPLAGEDIRRTSGFDRG